MELQTEILDVDGAHCASCAYAIERLGRKVSGVSEVTVDSRNQEIKVTHNGDPAALQKIIDIVRRLGYEAAVRSGRTR
jgi:copper chaperone CopZ